MNAQKKILLVEDEENIVAMYELKCRIEGFDFFSAPNVSEAMRIVTEVSPDIILLDIKLDQESGFDVLEKIKLDTATKEIPVIMFSNAYITENKEKALQMGAKEFLLKSSVLPGDTLEVVRKYI